MVPNSTELEKESRGAEWSGCAVRRMTSLATAAKHHDLAQAHRCCWLHRTQTRNVGSLTELRITPSIFYKQRQFEKGVNHFWKRLMSSEKNLEKC